MSDCSIHIEGYIAYIPSLNVKYEYLWWIVISIKILILFQFCLRVTQNKRYEDYNYAYQLFRKKLSICKGYQLHNTHNFCPTHQ